MGGGRWGRCEIDVVVPMGMSHRLTSDHSALCTPSARVEDAFSVNLGSSCAFMDLLDVDYYIFCF